MLSLGEQPQDLKHLSGMRPEVDIGPLDADRPTAINDDEAHLRHPHHSSHWLVGLGQEVVLARDGELLVEQHGHADPGDLLELSRLRGRVAIDHIHVGLLAEGRHRLLQLTELLNAELSGDAHMEDEHDGAPLARCYWVAHSFRIR